MGDAYVTAAIVAGLNAGDVSMTVKHKSTKNEEIDQI